MHYHNRLKTEICLGLIHVKNVYLFLSIYNQNIWLYFELSPLNIFVITSVQSYRYLGPNFWSLSDGKYIKGIKGIGLSESKSLTQSENKPVTTRCN